jgi:hypothetical protein
MDKELAIVLDEPQLAETIHEEIDARACRPDHFSQHFLAYLGDYRLRFSFLANLSKQQ